MQPKLSITANRWDKLRFRDMLLYKLSIRRLFSSILDCLALIDYQPTLIDYQPCRSIRSLICKEDVRQDVRRQYFRELLRAQGRKARLDA